ncbi:hypothetical protein ASG22_18780 [Chryseobacterium sp. Leaf405]|uniref:hypothetical protein n=1 Tax=Chryseobacterium sp. Leaf405 TaxID=1736367 RepID=UPI0006FC95B1|nr:hypothetical protein [Chryseobacterium sp. Leaf405]KQT31081.1 hypothetical protein ASG22_18780 [Chryseobacterium sp. Leaf405]
MKNVIFSILFLAIFSCKKENTVLGNPQNDSIKVVSEINKKDSTVLPQNKEEIFNFSTELCDNKGYFDSSKYSKVELEGTYKLWFQMGGVLLSTPSVFNLKGLQKVRAEKDEILAQLNRDFTNQKKVLENIKVVQDPYWENVRKQKLLELADEYEFRKTEIMAFSDPSILVNHKLSKGCENFARALNSDDAQMTEEWRKLREVMSKRNSDPQRIMNEFEERLHSSDKKDFATIDLITFGWGNCANDHINKTLHDEKMTEKFNSLFIKIDSECDEP